MELKNYKGYLPEYAERTLQRASQGFYVCPYCRSGEKRNKTAALKVYRNYFKCFSCDKMGDIFDLVGEIEGLTFSESTNRVRELFEGYSPRPAEEKERKTNVRNKYKDYIEQCQKDAAKAKEYFVKRGFTMKDVARFRLGYDKNTNGIVIPYGRDYSYYLWRSVTEKKFDKPKSSEAGPEPIYNRCALQKTVPCFICESPIDAISIMAVSECNAIAIGGIGVRKLMDYIDQKGVKAPLIVSLDDDDDKERNAGLESAKVLMGELMGRRIPFVFARYSKELYPKTRHKDANDMLCSRREVFENDIKDNVHRVLLVQTLMEQGLI